MRLEDMPGWNVADSSDPGLPCAMGSLLAAWAKASRYASLNDAERRRLDMDISVFGLSAPTPAQLRSTVDAWVDNIMQRVWLPGNWHEKINDVVAHENRDHIAEHSLRALLALKDGTLPRGANPDWDRECAEIGLLGSVEAKTSCRLNAPEDVVRAYDMGMILRYFWIGRLHEVNDRFPPSGDFADARAIARGYGWGDLSDAEIGIKAVGELKALLLD